MATYTDNFTEGSTILLTAHTPDVGGGSWTQLFDNTAGNSPWNVFGGDGDTGVQTSTNGSNIAHSVSWTPDNPNYEVTATMGTTIGQSSDDAFWIIARLQDTSNFYAAIIYGTGGTSAYIGKVVAGVWEQIATGSLTVATGDAIKFELIDGNLKLYQGGVERVSGTDSTFTTAGVCGMGMGALRAGGDDVNTGWDITQFVLNDLEASESETITMDKWLGRQEKQGNRRWVIVPSGTIGIKN